MSDAPRGPGWWQASDGKWYPPQPETPPPPPPPPPPIPSGVVPPPPPTYSPYGVPPIHDARSTGVPGGLSGTLQGFLWATFGLGLIGALISFAALSTFNDYWDAPAGSRAESQAFNDWLDLDDALGSFGGLFFFVWIVVIVLLIVWTFKAHTATQSLGPGPRRWSRGWTIGGWFIPIANFVIPRLVFSELERIALAPRYGGQAHEWKRTSTTAKGWLWWILLVVGVILVFIGNAIDSDDSLTTPSEIRSTYTLQGIGLLAWGVSSVFGALYVRSLSRRLSTAGLALEP